MPGFANKDLKRFHSKLADSVWQAHGQRCPCCRYPMLTPRKHNALNIRRRDRITVAHDRPVGFGGDATVWVFACQGCNSDQGNRTFRGWSIVLEREGDRRAAFVADLADRIDIYMRGKDNGHGNVAGPVSADA